MLTERVVEFAVRHREHLRPRRIRRDDVLVECDRQAVFRKVQRRERGEILQIRVIIVKISFAEALLRDLLVDIPINALLQRVSLQIALLRGQRVQRQEFARRQVKVPRAGGGIRMHAAVVGVALGRDAQELPLGHIGLRHGQLARPKASLCKRARTTLGIELLCLRSDLRRIGLKPCEHVVHLRIEGILRRELRRIDRAAVGRHILRRRVKLAAFRAQLKHRQLVALRHQHRAVVGLVFVFIDLRCNFKMQRALRADLVRRVLLLCAACGKIQCQYAAKQHHPFFHRSLLSGFEEILLKRSQAPASTRRRLWQRAAQGKQAHIDRMPAQRAQRASVPPHSASAHRRFWSAPACFPFF